MATSPSISLAGNPAYNAFVRASGLADAIDAADTARRKADLLQAYGLSAEDLDVSGERARRNIAGNYEARGVYRSGAQLRSQTEQESDQARRRAALELAAASGLGDLESALIAGQAGRMVKGSELGLDLAGQYAEEAAALSDPYGAYSYSTPAPATPVRSFSDASLGAYDYIGGSAPAAPGTRTTKYVRRPQPVAY